VIDLARGTDRTLRLTVTEDGVAVDITDADLTFTVRVDLASATTVIQKTTADPAEIDLTDPENGIAEIYLVPTDTEDLAVGTYVYDVWMTLSLLEYSLTQGQLLLTPSVREGV